MIDPAIQVGAALLLLLLVATAVRALSRWLRGPRVPWRHAFATALVMAIASTALGFIPMPSDALALHALALLLSLAASAALGGAYLARVLRSEQPPPTWPWGTRLAGLAALTSLAIVIAGTMLIAGVERLRPAATPAAQEHRLDPTGAGASAMRGAVRKTLNRVVPERRLQRQRISSHESDSQ